MIKTNSLICEYCQVLNPGGQKSCLACGAPLPGPKPWPIKPKITSYSRERKSPLQNERQVAEGVDKAYKTVMTVYGTFWRTLAEVAVIAMVGFAMGFIGALAGQPFLGVICALLVGVSVGLTIKNYYITLASAPIGTLLGAVISCGGYFLGLRGIWILIITAVCAILASVIGGVRLPYTQRNWWEKLRPFLGALGGLLFGLLGMSIGMGARAGFTLIGIA
jgi:hypothetical protein